MWPCLRVWGGGGGGPSVAGEVPGPDPEREAGEHWAMGCGLRALRQHAFPQGMRDQDLQASLYREGGITGFREKVVHAHWSRVIKKTL